MLQCGHPTRVVPAFKPYPFAYNQHILIDDNNYHGRELLIRLGHEIAEAAVSMLGTKKMCNEGETTDDCVIRLENTIRQDIGVEKRDLEKDPNE